MGRALGLSTRSGPMSQNEYDTAIAEFMRKKGITRCPTACAVADPCRGSRGRPRRVTRLQRRERSRPDGEVEGLPPLRRLSFPPSPRAIARVARPTFSRKAAHAFLRIHAVAHRAEFGAVACRRHRRTLRQHPVIDELLHRRERQRRRIDDLLQPRGRLDRIIDTSPRSVRQGDRRSWPASPRPTSII